MLDPKTPEWYEDETRIPQAGDQVYDWTVETSEMINHKDAMKDHSYGSLTKDEQTELQLFHSMKQDPYYKHYLHTHLSQYAEEED